MIDIQEDQIVEYIRQYAQIKRILSQYWAQEGYILYLFDVDDQSDDPYPVSMVFAPNKTFTD